MDRRQQKQIEKEQERKEDQREERAHDRARAQARARGPRAIRPLWLGVIGFVLATLALLRWLAIF